MLMKEPSMAEHPLVEQIKAIIIAGCGCDQSCLVDKDGCGCLNDAEKTIGAIVDWLDEQGYQAVRDELNATLL
jgi:hypothetical protein